MIQAPSQAVGRVGFFYTWVSAPTPRIPLMSPGVQGWDFLHYQYIGIAASHASDISSHLSLQLSDDSGVGLLRLSNWSICPSSPNIHNAETVTTRLRRLSEAKGLPPSLPPCHELASADCPLRCGVLAHRPTRVVIA